MKTTGITAVALLAGGVEGAFFQNLGDQFKQLGDNITTDLQRQGQRISAEAEQSVQNVAGNLSQAGYNVAETATQLGKKLSADAESLAQQVESDARRRIEPVIHSARSAWEDRHRVFQVGEEEVRRFANGWSRIIEHQAAGLARHAEREVGAATQRGTRLVRQAQQEAASMTCQADAAAANAARDVERLVQRLTNPAEEFAQRALRMLDGHAVRALRGAGASGRRWLEEAESSLRRAYESALRDHRVVLEQGNDDADHVAATLQGEIAAAYSRLQLGQMTVRNFYLEARGDRDRRTLCCDPRRDGGNNINDRCWMSPNKLSWEEWRLERVDVDGDDDAIFRLQHRGGDQYLTVQDHHVYVGARQNDVAQKFRVVVNPETMALDITSLARGGLPLVIRGNDYHVRSGIPEFEPRDPLSFDAHFVEATDESEEFGDWGLVNDDTGAFDDLWELVNENERDTVRCD